MFPVLEIDEEYCTESQDLGIPRRGGTETFFKMSGEKVAKSCYLSNS
jgi:hypothetical protein